jgi:hypothetical protein
MQLQPVVATASAASAAPLTRTSSPRRYGYAGMRLAFRRGGQVATSVVRIETRAAPRGCRVELGPARPPRREWAGCRAGSGARPAPSAGDGAGVRRFRRYLAGPGTGKRRLAATSSSIPVARTGSTLPPSSVTLSASSSMTSGTGWVAPPQT